MRKSFAVAAMAFAAVVFSSCCSCRKGSPKIGNLETDNWKLIEFRGEAVPSDKAITLAFDAGKKTIYGTAPCNNFFAGYSLLDDAEHNIDISNVGATRKYCPDTEIEDGFTHDLSSVKRLKFEGERLLMLNADGDLVALLMAVPKTAE